MIIKLDDRIQKIFTKESQEKLKKFLTLAIGCEYDLEDVKSLDVELGKYYFTIHLELDNEIYDSWEYDINDIIDKM